MCCSITALRFAFVFGFVWSGLEIHNCDQLLDPTVRLAIATVRFAPTALLFAFVLLPNLTVGYRNAQLSSLLKKPWKAFGATVGKGSVATGNTRPHV